MTIKLLPRHTPQELNREGWLTNLAELIVPRLEQITGKTMPNFRVTMGFPAKNALAKNRRVLGQCWDKVVSEDGTHQLFISPLIQGGDMVVAGVVGHELTHAIVGTKFGHKKQFVDVIRPLGLAGKPTSTVPGEAFIEFARPLIAKLGSYPHSPMAINPKYKMSVGRMIKAQCPLCEYKVRVTRVWLDNDEYGAPICPAHRVQMEEVS